MTCCLTAPNHNMSHCWHITSNIQWHSSRYNICALYEYKPCIFILIVLCSYGDYKSLWLSYQHEAVIVLFRPGITDSWELWRTPTYSYYHSGEWGCPFTQNMSELVGLNKHGYHTTMNKITLRSVINQQPKTFPDFILSCRYCELIFFLW